MSFRSNILGQKRSVLEAGGLEMGGIIGYNMADPTYFASKTNELVASDITVEAINATDVRFWITRDFTFINGTWFGGMPLTFFHDYSLRCKHFGQVCFKNQQSLISLIANGVLSTSNGLLQGAHYCSYLELNAMTTFGPYTFADADALVSINLPAAYNLSLITSAFYFSNLLEEVLLPECTVIGGDNILWSSPKIVKLYMPKLQSFASNPFGNIPAGCAITVPVAFATSNGGGEDVNIAFARARGCPINYV